MLVDWIRKRGVGDVLVKNHAEVLPSVRGIPEEPLRIVARTTGN